jgi:hypothetical protein
MISLLAPQEQSGFTVIRTMLCLEIINAVHRSVVFLLRERRLCKDATRVATPAR